jgi:adenine-specific DNA-methyltransferase
VIKYIGSKRVLVPVLGDIATAVGARSAIDLFTGTTRVAQEFKRRGMAVTAADVATYSEVLAQCYIATDSDKIDHDELARTLAMLNALPGQAGYFTEVFCEQARYLQPHNGARVDAIRERIERDFAGSELYPILLTALMLAADRVDSTTGVQMAYLKQWAPRSHRPLELRAPKLISGGGSALRGDALDVARSTSVDLAYLDPPYNQHRYFTNYHVWETLVRHDQPDAYGIARKRSDAREPETKSRFNSKRLMPAALRELINAVRAEVVVLSYNDEAWVGRDELAGWLREAGHEDVRVLSFDAKRYVGAQIGIHNLQGDKVGTVGRLRNVEYVFVAGPKRRIAPVLAGT